MSVEVVDELGVGVSGVHLSLGASDGLSAASGLTGNGGRANVEVLTGAHELAVTSTPDPVGAIEPFQVTVVGDTTVRVVLPSVRRAAGAPLDAVRPLAFGLGYNYPNPFNAETVMSYHLGVSGPTSLSIHNMAGQRVRSLVSGWRAAGDHRVSWRGETDSGRSAASGIYLYVLESGGQRQVRRLLLVR